MCPFGKTSVCRVQKKGYFQKCSTRASRIQRYRCLDCRRSFSEQTGRLSYRHKLPHLDQPVFRILAGGVSQRKCAEFLGIHRNTVAHKLVRLARFASGQHAAGEVEILAATRVAAFDEMETFEHSKMKPLSITVAVTEKSRLIITAKVASMPAKGLLAARSRKKYGNRKDERRQAITSVLSQVKGSLPRLSGIKSDDCPRYPELVRRLVPGVEHNRLKGRRGCVVGQGELKRGGFDPLFSLNHSCAMIRDNVKRLSRRTWCTTKRPDRLQALLELYRLAHNSRILHPKRKSMVRSGPVT